MADTRLDRRWHIADVHLGGWRSALSNSRDDLLKERSETKVGERAPGRTQEADTYSPIIITPIAILTARDWSLMKRDIHSVASGKCVLS